MTCCAAGGDTQAATCAHAKLSQYKQCVALDFLPSAESSFRGLGFRVGGNPSKALVCNVQLKYVKASMVHHAATIGPRQFQQACKSLEFQSSRPARARHALKRMEPLPSSFSVITPPPSPQQPGTTTRWGAGGFNECVEAMPLTSSLQCPMQPRLLTHSPICSRYSSTASTAKVRPAEQCSKSTELPASCSCCLGHGGRLLGSPGQHALKLQSEAAMCLCGMPVSPQATTPKIPPKI